MVFTFIISRKSRLPKYVSSRSALTSRLLSPFLCVFSSSGKAVKRQNTKSRCNLYYFGKKASKVRGTIEECRQNSNPLDSQFLLNVEHLVPRKAEVNSIL
jgi:hypothetical protein